MALTLGARISSFTATDQSYALKLLRQNIASNLSLVIPGPKSTSRGKKTQAADTGGERIRAEILDWEEDDVAQLGSVDVVVTCDCIYNEALVEPLNTTCAAICRLRGGEQTPTLCIIAQQLRSPDVFESWIKSFHQKFHTWQVPDWLLNEELKENSGFVVHVGIVR